MYIEEALLEKMAKWIYSPSELWGKVLDNILKEESHFKDNAIMVAKDIQEQTLRKVIPNLSDKEVNEALKMHQHSLAPQFSAFLFFSNDIESVVQSNPYAWKNIMD